VDYITVNAITEVPNVDFVADLTVLNIAQSVSFTDLSTLQPTSWSWDFGDGNNSIEQNPTHSYASAGFYTVSLTATNSVGSGSEIKINYIEVVLEDYCDASSGSTSYENIENVTFGTINNDSGSDGYSDYTSISTDLNAAETYTFSVTYDKDYDSDQVIVWIDWNRDHIFTDDEKYIVADGSGDNGNTPYNYDIEVPYDAPEGTTRMRVRLHDTGYGPNDTPCGDSDYGEVEDYSVNVINTSVGIDSKTDQLVNIYPNPANNFFVIKSDIKNFNYRIVALDGRAVLNGKSDSNKELSIDVSNLSVGMYNLILNYKDGQIIKKIIIK